MLELHDICKKYKAGPQSVHALSDVTLTIAGGEFVSIVGPSGAGKSTLLHILGALDSPDSGKIRFKSHDIGTMNEHQQSEFRRHQVGFVFQFFNLLPTMSAWENVAIPKLLDGKSLRSSKPAAMQLLELVGLADRADHRPAELSGGEMQRVAVARALVMDPPLIVADEPTANLDSKTGAAIVELLSNIAHVRGSERAAILVTHNLVAANLTDRIVTLQDGRVISDESTSGKK